jgi:hypothetical protein
MKRLEAKGKGILLLHDIQARTVAALPRILHELKARGYRIVHVVPATPGAAGDADRAAAMAVASAVGNRGDLALAENSEFRVCPRETLPAPALSDSGLAARQRRASITIALGIGRRKRILRTYRTWCEPGAYSTCRSAPDVSAHSTDLMNAGYTLVRHCGARW